MKNYQEMTDFELELLVAKHHLGEGNYSYDAEKSEVYLAGMDGGEFLPNAYFRPINSWADAGPIAEKNFISFDQHYNGSYVKVWGYSNKGLHEASVLRSDLKKGICIVFLMMKGSE